MRCFSQKDINYKTVNDFMFYLDLKSKTILFKLKIDALNNKKVLICKIHLYYIKKTINIESFFCLKLKILENTGHNWLYFWAALKFP